MSRPNFDFPVTLTFPVRWGEMDALGHVNNTVYFRYFEDVRIEYIRQLGLDLLQPKVPLGPILAQIGCNFMRPVVFPDTLTVGCRIASIGNTSFRMEQGEYSQQQQRVVATGESVIVMLNYKTGEKVPIDATLLQQIAALEGK